MNKTLALVSGLTVLALTGCASQQDRKAASGSFDYVKAQDNAPVQIPESLDKPEFSDEYALPEVGEQADPDLVGKKLVVQSPALVMPLVTGSHVEEGAKRAMVWFDQVDDSQPLDKAIWNSLLSFLDQQGIGVDTFDSEEGVLITDWMVIGKEEDSSWYDWSESDEQVGRRFEFTMEKKPHGRTAALMVELIDYMATRGDDVTADLNDLQERREEVDILNQVINHYEYQIQLEDSRRIARIRQGLNTEMGFNPDGEPAYVVAAKYDVAWPRTLLVLRKLNFDVKDLDKSTGLLFVTYNGTDDGWWNNLIGSDEELLEEGDYRLQLNELSADKTSITFMNDESEPFDAKQVSELFDAFAQVMSEDNLDI